MKFRKMPNGDFEVEKTFKVVVTAGELRAYALNCTIAHVIGEAFKKEFKAFEKSLRKKGEKLVEDIKINAATKEANKIKS